MPTPLCPTYREPAPIRYYRQGEDIALAVPLGAPTPAAIACRQGETIDLEYRPGYRHCLTHLLAILAS